MNVETVSANQPGGLEQKWKILISVMFGIFMIILDATVINVAFPTLRREFGATLADAQWVLSIYVLSLGVTTPVSGFLADRFGIKRVYLFGLAVFVIGSFLCGLAPSLGWLIAARALQGFGGGVAQPLGPAQLYRAFPPKEQGTALGYFGIALVFAPALGPILGGWLVDANLWRLICFINIPIGIIGVFLGSRFLLDYRVERKPKFDPLGLITAVIGFGSVLYEASIAETNGWTGSTTLLALGIGIVALVARERTQDKPATFWQPCFSQCGSRWLCCNDCFVQRRISDAFIFAGISRQDGVGNRLYPFGGRGHFRNCHAIGGKALRQDWSTHESGCGFSHSMCQYLATDKDRIDHSDFLYCLAPRATWIGSWPHAANLLCGGVEQCATE